MCFLLQWCLAIATSAHNSAKTVKGSLPLFCIASLQQMPFLAVTSALIEGHYLVFSLTSQFDTLQGVENQSEK